MTTEEDSEEQESAEKKSARERMGGGIRQGLGVLSAFKEALEETIQEARDRGDFSTERAKEAMKGALSKAQTAAAEARERLDFVSQNEFDALQRAVGAIVERVADLEKSVFGEARAEPEPAEGEGNAAGGEEPAEREDEDVP